MWVPFGTRQHIIDSFFFLLPGGRHESDSLVPCCPTNMQTAAVILAVQGSRFSIRKLYP
jgi:hypothetical protein